MAILPPALARVALPSVLMWCTVPAAWPVLWPSKYQCWLPFFTVTPLASVKSCVSHRLPPPVLRLLPPSVTLSSLPLPLLFKT